MRSKFLMILLTCFIVGNSLFQPTEVLANDDFEQQEVNDSDSLVEVELDATDFSTGEELADALNKSLEEYDYIRIVNLYEDETLLEESYNEDMISPRGAYDTVSWSTRNVTNLKNSFGGDYLNVSGAPDVVIGLSEAQNKTYSISYGSTHGCPKGVVGNAAWGTTRGKTLTYSGTWKVPKKNAGKNVKFGYLHMRPEYQNKKMDVYSKNYGTTKWVKKGSTTSKRAYAVNIYKTYTYK